MPLGNGDVGVNVWVQKNGSVYFYIGKNDAWDENGRLLKIGKVVVTIDPNPFTAGNFRQELSLRDGCVRITAGEFQVLIWVDAHDNMIRVQTKSATSHRLTAALEHWRTTTRMLEPDERHSAYGIKNNAQPIYSYADTVIKTGRGVAWVHQNKGSVWPLTMTGQGLGSLVGRYKDPLSGRCFGALLTAGKAASTNGTTLQTGFQKAHLLETRLLTGIFSSTQQWLNQVEKESAAKAGFPLETKWTRHRSWWRDFWSGSYIHLKEDSATRGITQGYLLQRFLTACSARGPYPVKFNGAVFTVDSTETNKPFDADFRQWGGPYWLQNTRLIYWPLLTSGNFDMMVPFFTMYKKALPIAQLRTQLFFGHAGAYFPETMYFWGTYTPDNYGWNRQGMSVDSIENRYIRYHYEGGLEVLAMMIGYYRYTLNRSFLETTLLPFAGEILLFYQDHYPVQKESGKMVYRIEPAQALETYAKVINPLPVIAGLKYNLKELLAMPPADIPKSFRTRWRQQLDLLPPLPTGEKKAVQLLLPAEQLHSTAQNTENCELYAIFPFRLFGVGLPERELAVNTFFNRPFPGIEGWRQDDMHAAYAGLGDTAMALLVKRMRSWHPASRFPGFRGPNFDWVPDMDHGSNGVHTLQAMLLQSVGKNIYLFPAWPKKRDVKFRLHAPYKTIVEAELKEGKLVKLKVIPSSRTKQVIIL